MLLRSSSVSGLGNELVRTWSAPGDAQDAPVAVRAMNPVGQGPPYEPLIALAAQDRRMKAASGSADRTGLDAVWNS